MSTSRPPLPTFVKPPISGADEPPWLRQVVSDVQHLLQLSPGWDSYGAMPIDQRAAATAFTLLFEVMHRDAPAPSVAPLSDSGIQLDWHTRGIDVELVISPLGHASIWCRDRRTGTEWEGDPGRDPATLVLGQE